MVLKKGIFVQLTIKIPPKKGSFGQHTQKMRVIHKITLIFYAKNVNWGELGGRIRRFGAFSA